MLRGARVSANRFEMSTAGRPSTESMTTMPSSASFPLFVIVIVKVMSSPKAASAGQIFSMSIAGSGDEPGDLHRDGLLPDGDRVELAAAKDDAAGLDRVQDVPGRGCPASHSRCTMIRTIAVSPGARFVIVTVPCIWS